MNKAVFLDRDGVLIETNIVNGKPYAIKNIKDFKLTNGVKDAIRRLKKAGYLLIMVTNQPDVGRGVISDKTASTINYMIKSILRLDTIMMCPHTPEDKCLCRKPSPMMLIGAANAFNINLSKSYMIGDRWSDIETGEKAGCKTILIDKHYKNDKPATGQDHTVDDIREAVDWILGRVEDES
jgi:D-glycero-D-manno-heptose 1,7-bisphosphate phosphatase